MKSLVFALLVAILGVGLVGCSSSTSQPAANGSATSNSSPVKVNANAGEGVKLN